MAEEAADGKAASTCCVHGRRRKQTVEMLLFLLPGEYQAMKRPATNQIRRMSRLALSRLPLATAIHFACFAPVYADADPQDTTPPPAAAPTPGERTQGLETITVTAQKRTENAQDVPISIDVLSGETLKQMNVANTVGVLKLLPSVSYTTFGPGFGQIYMRGVVSGGDGNHT